MQNANFNVWFTDTVLPYEKDLSGFIQKYSSDTTDVADIRQEVYLRVYSYAQKKIPASMKPFMFQIARNLIIDKARRRACVHIELTDSPADFPANDSLVPEHRIAARRTLTHMQEVLEDLPPRCREVFFLRRVEGYSQRETAEQLGISESTVEKHMKKGLKRVLSAFDSGTDINNLPSRKAG